ncbi:MAG: anthranilate synthase component I [Planctomycetota bacterium]|nr:anthranilate synthase component I [Planctomycetota bacterium]
MIRRIFADQLTPVLAYRRLVAPDDRTAPSFLFESVEQDGGIGRHSILGVRPGLEVLATADRVRVLEHAGDDGTEEKACDGEDPFDLVRRIRDEAIPVELVGDTAPPDAFQAGFVGFAGYDTARWAEPEKLPFEDAPLDDRGLPDLHLGFYGRVLVFDHVAKTVFVVATEQLRHHESRDDAVRTATRAVEELVSAVMDDAVHLAPGTIDLDTLRQPEPPTDSSMTREGFEDAVRRTQEYIAAGDAFQVVLSQRFERSTEVDPFDLYRALRVVNPSPYQIYLQAQGCMLVAASPEILCRVRDGEVVNRPLAGTRRRGRDEAEDLELERDLLADEKERAEHVMLVDLGRNDLGRVCESGSIELQEVMQVERYSHVMHIGSTVTGRLRPGFDEFDALRATLPVGTVSGAPKIRAMQIIDELEPVRRGPYAGGIGAIGLDGDLDVAIALRTMVVPHGDGVAPWSVHLQAGAGVVLDSVPESEWRETVNKAAALGRAIDLAEQAFGARSDQRPD